MIELKPLVVAISNTPDGELFPTPTKPFPNTLNNGVGIPVCVAAVDISNALFELVLPAILTCNPLPVAG